jgi:hypothetical protein
MTQSAAAPREALAPGRTAFLLTWTAPWWTAFTSTSLPGTKHLARWASNWPYGPFTAASA